VRESHGQEEGGEPACLLHQVCEECGRVREDLYRADCEHCGHNPHTGEHGGGSGAGSGAGSGSGRAEVRTGGTEPGRRRDRDQQGKARNARPRDGLGRPLPYGHEGVPRQPEGVTRTPGATLAEAQQLLDEGLPFHAHEVLEDAWKASPAPERALWKGLAQLAVGITHLARGNTTGGARLLLRGAEGVGPYGQDPPHGIDAAGLVTWARATAAEAGELTTPVPVTVRPPSLRDGGDT
jgi:uncharacterized protein